MPSNALPFPQPGSKAEGVLADLRVGTMTPRQIAAARGCKRPYVTMVRTKAIARGLLDPPPGCDAGLSLRIDSGEVLDALRLEAAERDMRTEDLALEVLRVVAVEDLFVAVLADGK